MLRNPPLSAEQISALQGYAVENGRYWKSKLLTDWEKGRSQGPLQQVRNNIGPSGLLRLKLPAVAKTTP
jgi:hypothetical protein